MSFYVIFVVPSGSIWGFCSIVFFKNIEENMFWMQYDTRGMLHKTLNWRKTCYFKTGWPDVPYYTGSSLSLVTCPTSRINPARDGLCPVFSRLWKNRMKFWEIWLSFHNKIDKQRVQISKRRHYQFSHIEYSQCGCIWHVW